MRIFKNIFAKKGLKSKNRKELIRLVESLENELQTCKDDALSKLNIACERLERICWDRQFRVLPTMEMDENDRFYRLFKATELTENNAIDYITETSEKSKEIESKPRQEIMEPNNRLLAISKTENALAEKNSELQKLNEELDKFVYSASHDLRAPIASIQGLINIALIENSNEVVKQYLELMSNSANKLDTLIRDIINYSWNSRIELVLERIDLHGIIREAFDNYSYLPDFDKILKMIDVQENADFYTDKSRFKIIINNIIGNAIKFNENNRRDPSIAINILCNAKQAIIEISDNGEGIPMEHIPHVFEMFYKANPHKSGSGLGLYIAKEALTKLNGSINVQSSMGDYTSFTINIPNMVETISAETRKKLESVNCRT